MIFLSRFKKKYFDNIELEDWPNVSPKGVKRCVVRWMFVTYLDSVGFFGLRAMHEPMAQQVAREYPDIWTPSAPI